jgi:hypothetical protein
VGVEVGVPNTWVWAGVEAPPQTSTATNPTTKTRAPVVPDLLRLPLPCIAFHALHIPH